VFGGCVLVAVALLRVGGGRLHSLKQTVVESMHRRRNKRAYTRITPRRARGTTEGAAPAALKYESMWRPRAGSSLLGAFRLLSISLAPGIVLVLLDHFVRARSKIYLYYMPLQIIVPARRVADQILPKLERGAGGLSPVEFRAAFCVL